MRESYSAKMIKEKKKDRQRVKGKAEAIVAADAAEAAALTAESAA